LLSITSVTLESRCPLMISTRSSVASVPLTPSQLSTAMRLPSAYSEIINLRSHLILQHQTNSDLTAAPIRVLLFVSLKVCRVPKKRAFLPYI
jgi:hypothetical protein